MMRKNRYLLFVFVLVLLLKGCSSGMAPRPTCQFQGAKLMLVAGMIFGRGVKGGQVSDANWTEFQRDILTKQFPQGLTVTNSSGQWVSSRLKGTVNESSSVRKGCSA